MASGLVLMPLMRMPEFVDAEELELYTEFMLWALKDIATFPGRTQQMCITATCMIIKEDDLIHDYAVGDTLLFILRAASSIADFLDFSEPDEDRDPEELGTATTTTAFFPILNSLRIHGIEHGRCITQSEEAITLLVGLHWTL